MNLIINKNIKEKFRIYEDLLRKWQEKTNLIARSTIDNIYERHIMDCTQICDILPEHTQTLVDFGSGAGFPAMVIAIAMPEIKVYAIESDKKKCAFLKTVSRETNTENIEVVNSRIKDFTDKQSNIIPDVITARALGSLKQLIEYSLPLVQRNKNCQCIFLKGKNYEQEIIEAEETYNFTTELFPSRTDSESRIIALRFS